MGKWPKVQNMNCPLCVYSSEHESKLLDHLIYNHSLDWQQADCQLHHAKTGWVDLSSEGLDHQALVAAIVELRAAFDASKKPQPDKHQPSVSSP